MKQIIASKKILLLLSVIYTCHALAQNPVWTLPGNYRTPVSIFPIPNYSTNFVGGSNPLEFSFDNYADFAHAAMSDAQGNPLFYVIDGARKETKMMMKQ